MPRDKEENLLQPFIIKAAQKKKYVNLTALSGVSYRLECKKKKKGEEFTENDQIYKDWDELKGRKYHKEDSKNRFMNALNCSCFLTVLERKKSEYIFKFNNEEETAAAKAKKKGKSGSKRRLESDDESLVSSPSTSTGSLSPPVTSPPIIDGRPRKLRRGLNNFSSSAAAAFSQTPPEAENIPPCTSAKVFNKKPRYPRRMRSALGRCQENTAVFYHTSSETSSEQDAHCSRDSTVKPEEAAMNVVEELPNARVDTGIKVTSSNGCISQSTPIQTPISYQSSGVSPDVLNTQLFMENHIHIPRELPKSSVSEITLPVGEPSCNETGESHTSSGIPVNHQDLSDNTQSSQLSETSSKQDAHCSSDSIDKSEEAAMNVVEELPNARVDTGIKVISSNGCTSQPTPIQTPISYQSSGVSPDVMNTQLFLENHTHIPGELPKSSVSEIALPVGEPSCNETGESHTSSGIPVNHKDLSDNTQSSQLLFEDFMDCVESGDLGISQSQVEEVMKELWDSVFPTSSVNCESPKALDVPPVEEEDQETLRAANTGNLSCDKSCQTEERCIFKGKAVMMSTVPEEGFCASDFSNLSVNPATFPAEEASSPNSGCKIYTVVPGNYRLWNCESDETVALYVTEPLHFPMLCTSS